MKIQKSNSIPKSPVTLGVLAAVLIGGALLYVTLVATDMFSNNQRDRNPVSSDYTGPEDTDNSESSSEPDDGNRNINTNMINPENPDPTQNNTPPNEKLNTTIHIPSHQASGETITINVAIDNSWGNNAKCTLELSGPQSKTVTSEVFPQAQISGCQLRATGLLPGEYTATVYAEKDNQRTNSETLTIYL